MMNITLKNSDTLIRHCICFVLKLFCLQLWFILYTCKAPTASGNQGKFEGNFPAGGKSENLAFFFKNRGGIGGF